MAKTKAAKAAKATRRAVPATSKASARKPTVTKTVAKARVAKKLPAKKAPAKKAAARTVTTLASVPLPRPTIPEPATDTNGAQGQYVYCIIQSEAPLTFGPLGIGHEPAEVRTVHFKNLAAVVSATPMVVHDPTRENVLAHQRVNETVMLQHTVLPMSFGTVFKTTDDIVELLRSAYDAFTDVLQKMRDKVEFGLKVLWDRDQIIREIEEEDEDIRRLKNEISSQKGSTYFARMQYGRMS